MDILTFIENQNLDNYQKLVNLGIKLKELKNGEWVDKCEFVLPFPKDRLITLYNKDDNGIFKPSGIGIF